MKSWREFAGHANNIWEKFQDKYCRKQMLMVIKIPKYQPLFVKPKALLPLLTKHSSLPQLHLAIKRLISLSFHIWTASFSLYLLKQIHFSSTSNLLAALDGMNWQWVLDLCQPCLPVLWKKGFPSLAGQQQSYGREAAILSNESYQKYEKPKQHYTKTDMYQRKGSLQTKWDGQHGLKIPH